MNRKYYQVQYKYDCAEDWEKAYWFRDVNGMPLQYDTYGEAYWAMDVFIHQIKDTITEDFCYRVVYCEVTQRFMDTHYAEVTEE